MLNAKQYDHLTFDVLNWVLNFLNKCKGLGSEPELWLPVPEFEHYQFSNYGRVKNPEGTILRPDSPKGWYWRYTFCDDGRMKRMSVHRLIAIAYVPNPENKPFVNHKNGVKFWNYPSNLEWTTPAENSQHAYKNGLMPELPKYRGANNARSKPVNQLDILGNLIARWESANMAGIALGIAPRQIGAVCHGDLKQTGGFKWEFATK